MTDNYSWVSQIQWQENLDGDNLLIAETIGLENYIKLVTILAKTTMYFSTKPLDELRPIYIKQNPQKTPKELAREMGVSERYVQIIRAESELKKNQGDLFAGLPDNCQ